MNYLEHLAHAIAKRCSSDYERGDRYELLWLIYAVLCQSLGTAVTNEQVHDAWSAWQTVSDPFHRSALPFDLLSPAVQELDTEYRDAIRWVAAGVTRP